MVYHFKKHKIFISGILIGLALSTRNVLAIPIIIAFMYELKHKHITFKQLSIIGIIALFVFTLTFLPFTINHIEEFKTVNPFIIQSSALMPFELTLLFIFLAFITGYLCKSEFDVYFYSALILFLTIIGYYIYLLTFNDFHNTFFNSIADISYFILCLPFALYYTIQKEKI